MKDELLMSSLAKRVVIGGIYEHYKGYRYLVLSVARHSETLEECVVYKALYGNEGVWVRPLTMFLENVPDKGCARFAFLGLEKT